MNFDLINFQNYSKKFLNNFFKKDNVEDFIPYGKHSISEEDTKEVLKVLRSNNITQGEIVPKFEKAISEKVQSKYSIAVNSATSALHLSCLALGVGEGDIVWTSPISFVASANCALYCRAKIDFVDVDPSSGLINIDSLEKKLFEAKKNNTLPKVLIPVHLAGSSCDMLRIYSLSKEFGFSIIEDASHAIGGHYNNYPVGSCKYSHITVFSFHPVKIITTGEGGLVSTNNELIAYKIEKMRSHGIVKDSAAFKFPEVGSWRYEQQFLGFNYRMNDMQAALGLSQLKRLENIVLERNKQLKFYSKILGGLPIKQIKIPPNVKSSVHLAIIKLEKISPDYYFKVFEGMRSNGIGVQLHYIPIFKHPYYKRFKFDQKKFPGSLNYSSSAMSIPLFPGLNINQQIRVKDTLKKLL